MIRNPKPFDIAFRISLLLSLVLGIASYFIWKWEIIDSLIIFALSLGISFFLFFYTIEFFIYRKIKLIYKTIHSLKTNKYDAVLSNFEWNRDPISEMNKEVIQWARDNKIEMEELKQVADFRKEFLGNVSHELKTPIFNIQGYIHTLLDGALNDPEVNTRFLEKAAKSVDRLCDLVDDLLAISQLESGELTMEPERFDITQLVKEIYEQLQNKKVHFTIKEGCDQPFFVLADRQRIQQVLVNLISNSVKYGKENGTTTAAFYDMDENILVEIADNGPGIEQEHLGRIFERFYRIDKSRSRENAEGGTGLGLAIVKHIIEAHHQTINVRSKVGLGTTFGFTLQKGRIFP